MKSERKEIVVIEMTVAEAEDLEEAIAPLGENIIVRGFMSELGKHIER